jgi:hypothetical protein
VACILRRITATGQAPKVRAAYFLLLLLIVAAPAILLFDGLLVLSSVAIITAIALAITAVTIRPGEAGYLATLARQFALIAIVPALWMVIQLLPLPVQQLTNPIWDSAATALGRPVTGSITIDTGTTLIALFRYLTFVGAALIAMASAIDRQRAAWILSALAGAAVCIAFVVVGHDLGGLKLLTAQDGIDVRAAAIDTIALGVVLCTAAAILSVERLETRRSQPDFIAKKYHLAVALCICGTAVSWIVLIAVARIEIIFAAALGFATLLAIVAIRRFGLNIWISAAALIPLVLAAILFLASRHNPQVSDPTLALAPQGADAMLAITQRILAGSGWAGTGAGTFLKLVPIYRDIDEVVTSPLPPTAASALAVELGWPLFWACMVGLMVVVAVLLRGALQRGRDSFFSAAGAASAATLALLTFANAGLFSTLVLILGGAMLGLALAQRQSRTHH